MTDPDLERIARRFAPRRDEPVQPPQSPTDWWDIILNALACVGVVLFVIQLATWVEQMK